MTEARNIPLDWRIRDEGNRLVTVGVRPLRPENAWAAMTINRRANRLEARPRTLSPISTKNESHRDRGGGQERTILGIDPGTATLGWGVVRCKASGSKVRYLQHGAITTPSNWDMPRRLGKLFAGVRALLEGYEPDAVAVEELFFGRNVSSAITVGQARGTVLLAAHLSAPGGTPVFEYKPAEIKQAVTSYGAANKLQVQQMVKTLLNLKGPELRFVPFPAK